MKKNKILIVIVIAIVIAVGGVFAAVMLSQTTTNPRQATPVIRPSKEAQVAITNNGFEPATLTVKKGTKVTWTNNGQTAHQIASNPHPSHDELKKLYSDVLNEKQSYGFSFSKAGKFNYHDELNPVVNGQIIVKE